MKKIFLINLMLLVFNVNASHFMGGEITWECIKSGPSAGKYIFQMKVYRDCSSVTFAQSSQTLTVHNYPTLGTTTPIILNFVSVTDISPAGTFSSGNSCFSCANGDFGAKEEYIWRSNPTTLAGFPPAEGWHFTWGNCCRSSNISNGMADDDWTLRAVMYPYTDPVTGIPIPADPCYDSSPEFKELSKTIISTGYPFTYSHNATDVDLDYIEYSWGHPLGNALGYDPSVPNSTALSFSGGSPPYTVNSPIPGNSILDASTGEITYMSMTPGVFTTCMKVEAFKCGQLVAEIYRDIVVIMTDYGLYNPPADGFNDPPVIPEMFIDSATGLMSYEMTVNAGDFISFNISAEDYDTYNSGALQNITLDVYGGQFSSDYVNTANCLHPPCATFNDGNGVTPPFSAPGIVSGIFEWQTDYSHISNTVVCGTNSNVFTFLVKAYDDFCPFNGIVIATIKITVISSTSLIEEHTLNKKLIKLIDILGRDVEERKNTPLLYIYDDGRVEKKIIIE